MPILDIQVDVNLNQMNRIDFEFYQKPTKNQRVIFSRLSAELQQEKDNLNARMLKKAKKY